MSDLKLHAYYYSFASTGQREIDLILHAVAKAGKAFHNTSQWIDDGMTGFYEHCDGDTCEQWIQNAANKAAAELAALRADAERLEWYFGPASKADWLDTFMTGVRENWTVDQWRAAIDAAMERADET